MCSVQGVTLVPVVGQQQRCCRVPTMAPWDVAGGPFTILFATRDRAQHPQQLEEQQLFVHPALVSTLHNARMTGWCRNKDEQRQGRTGSARTGRQASRNKDGA
jgi:hypothetical protein